MPIPAPAKISPVAFSSTVILIILVFKFIPSIISDLTDLKKFNDLTGCAVLVNTSFNVRGEPIVASPSDAFKCFMGTDLDILVIENFILNKKNQDSKLKEDYKNKYELD